MSAPLAAKQPCVYTVTRTVGRRAVLELDFHVRRLASSLRTLLTPAELDMAADEADISRSGWRSLPGRVATPTPAGVRTWVEPALLKPRVNAAIGAALDTVSSPAEDVTVRLTVGRTIEGALGMETAVAPLRQRPQGRISVAVAPTRRSDPTVKDTMWSEQREKLMAEVGDRVHELLLTHEQHGTVLEGASSNFFAVRRGELHTADAGVLPGSIRAIVLQLAEEQGIPVRMHAPSLDSLPTWDEAFLTSTSRVVLPVHDIIMPGGGPSMPLRSTELGDKLYADVQRRLRERSESIVAA
eukprot:PLAT9789.1.p1 GENE.PLAT9789.1~~PLAT9789.1.p1  ORF type:complete len:298 (-),score=109.39 PLAT9789.1:131-1024(-)